MNLLHFPRLAFDEQNVMRLWILFKTRRIVTAFEYCFEEHNHNLQVV